MAKPINNIYMPNTDDLLDLQASNMIVNSNINSPSSSMHIHDDTVLVVGDFSVKGSEFKVMLKMMREMAMEKHPEEFI